VEESKVAYYPDLSPYEYWLDHQPRAPADPNVLNIGWLGKRHPYPREAPSDAFLERLWAFCRVRVHQTRGFHSCELKPCPPPHGLRVQRNGEELHLGSAEIRVFGRGEIVYAAPNLIYHYVAAHHYRPPEDFVQAVLEGPWPGSPGYQARASEYDWRVSDNSPRRS
jgi:hypothetical protein